VLNDRGEEGRLAEGTADREARGASPHHTPFDHLLLHLRVVITKLNPTRRLFLSLALFPLNNNSFQANTSLQPVQY
jgi:hypothetical protein